MASRSGQAGAGVVASKEGITAWHPTQFVKGEPEKNANGEETRGLGRRGKQKPTGSASSTASRATAGGTNAGGVVLHDSPHPVIHISTHLVFWHLDVQVSVRHYNRHRLPHVLHKLAAGYGNRAQLEEASLCG